MAEGYDTQLVMREIMRELDWMSWSLILFIIMLIINKEAYNLCTIAADLQLDCPYLINTVGYFF